MPRENLRQMLEDVLNKTRGAEAQNKPATPTPPPGNTHVLRFRNTPQVKKANTPAPLPTVQPRFGNFLKGK